LKPCDLQIVMLYINVNGLNKGVVIFNFNLHKEIIAIEHLLKRDDY